MALADNVLAIGATAVTFLAKSVKLLCSAWAFVMLLDVSQ